MNTEIESPGLRTVSSVPAIKRELERMIGAKEIRSGERINESAIGARLGVSRGPIREACRLLEREGLLKSVMNKGFFVRTLSAKEALDLYEIRIVLFGMVGSLASRRITQAQLEFLESLHARMDSAAATGDIVAFYDLNTEFHQTLVEIADNYKVREIWPTLESELQLFRRRGLTTVDRMQASNKEHRAIVDALASGNAAQAARMMEHHIIEGRTRFLQSIGA